MAGDGNAEFLTDMTEDEYAIHLIEEDQGWKEFRDKIFGRKPHTVPSESEVAFIP